ncbi:hypothetical protein [Leptospira alexanderi]|uniref:Uncharacterized protein n=1 Tax=Leptospira alexanderi serovar Manhao 3 str. L 60 TaxID=1049759 RepID=V6I9U0_9LEPT|nr:hypothetical protein [Leptospira alexanderi]EQA64564.1 hypothetical protein LEP1GSC062_0463 [Leptospira alexanderi serovar Manhao 3 str. L 60]
MRQSISYKIEFYRTVVPTRLSFFEKERIVMGLFFPIRLTMVAAKIRSITNPTNTWV